MVQMYPFIIADFEKALGSKLGVTTLPVFGDGPLAGKSAGNSFHNWVIPPRTRATPTSASPTSRSRPTAPPGPQLASMVGSPPANKEALASLKDPNVKFFAQLGADPGIPLLDSVIPVNLALYYYKQLQAAFAGTTSPQEAMQNVDNERKQLNP